MSELYLDIEICRSEPTKDKRWVISGYATTVDLGSEGFIITREAIQRSVDDLIRRSTMLLNHDQNRPIGRVLRAEARDQGLFIEAFVSRSEEQIWRKIQEGVLNKFSVRGKVLNSYEEFDNDVNQKVLFITRMELQEVSVVSVPAVPQAEILDWVERKNKTEEVNKLADETKDTQEIKESEATEEVKASAETEEPEKEETKEVQASTEEKEPSFADFLKEFKEFKSSMEGKIEDLGGRLGDFEEAIAGAVIEELPESETPTPEVQAAAETEEIETALSEDEKGLVENAIKLSEELAEAVGEEKQEEVEKLKEILASLLKTTDETEEPGEEAEGLPPEKVAASATPPPPPASSQVTEIQRSFEATTQSITTQIETLAKGMAALNEKVEKIPIYRGAGPVDEKKGDPIEAMVESEEFKQKHPYDRVTAYVDKCMGK